MSDNTNQHRRLSTKTVIIFLLAASLCVLLAALSVASRLNIERLNMERIILEKSGKANEALSRLLYKTQTLSVFALKGYTRDEFENIAITLMDDPAILNMLIAPGGVVTDVYPVPGNEAVVGLDFFSEGAGNKEAVQAREAGTLVLGGPFDSIQGSQIIVGRLPVYAEQPNGGKTFWGLVSVTLKYPDVLNSAGLNEVRFQGFDYEIWRINPDDGERQTIAGNAHTEGHNPRYMEKVIVMQNAEWVFRIYPILRWYEHPDIWIALFAGLCLSSLIAVVVQDNQDLRLLKDRLEVLSHTDPLTGIYNRRYFMATAFTHLKRSERLGATSAVIMMDIDHFKNINDNYGHLVGDKVLKEITAAVQSALRPYDLFGRFGGEEFIVLASDINKEAALTLAERIRRAISSSSLRHGDEHISVTASLGVAELSSESDFHNALKYADEALYRAKQAGRDRVELSEPAPTTD